MGFSSWLQNGLRFRVGERRRSRTAPHKRATYRLVLEALEDRTLPSNFWAASVADLISDINAANAAGGANTITLTAPTTSPYVLTTVNNTTDGPTGLPVISGGSKNSGANTLTIIGNGDTIERSAASGAPNFRLFDVAAKGALTLQNLTLQNGLAFGASTAAEGGADVRDEVRALTAGEHLREQHEAVLDPHQQPVIVIGLERDQLVEVEVRCPHR